jgi:hypothetical protein
MEHPLDGVEAKISRGFEHIDELDFEIAAFVRQQVVLSLAESVDSANPSRVKELVGLLVEQVAVDHGQVNPEQIVWTPAARPFFCEQMAAAVGLKRPRRESNPRRRP